MSKLIAFVNDGCLDPECNAPAKRNWDGRVVYCDEYCMLKDVHFVTTPTHNDSHSILGVYGVVIEPDCCEHCEYCGAKIIQGIDCEFEHDEQCKELARNRRELWIAMTK